MDVQFSGLSIVIPYAAAVMMAGYVATQDFFLILETIAER
jgi:hypothetical protein